MTDSPTVINNNGDDQDGCITSGATWLALTSFEDEHGTILEDHPHDKRSIGDIVEFYRPQVDMKGVHTTWSKESGSCGGWT